MDCTMTSSILSANYNTILIEFGIILVTSKVLHALLRNVYQPRVFSDLLLGIVLAQFRVLSLTNAINLVFGKIGGFVFAPYLFALGVEMDPGTLLDVPTADAVVAYAGILSTSVLVTLFHMPLMQATSGVVHERSLRSFLGLAAVLANTASPVLTRLTTDLKIAKTAVGRLAVGAGLASDMVTTMLIAVGSMIWRDAGVDGSDSSPILQPVLTAAVLVVVIVSAFVSRAMAEWVGGRNPEGRRMRGFDLSLVALAAAALCWLSSALRLDVNMAAFLVGLAFPSEGRVSRLLVSKINFVLSSFVLPLYVSHVCLSLRQTTDDIEVAGLGRTEGFRAFVMELPFPWWKVFFVTVMGTLGKLTGCAAAGLLRGLGWLEALALGMLLNVKGYFHIYCAQAAFDAGIITDKSFMAIIFMVALNVAVTPMVGMGIASWARRSVQWRLMGLQHHDPSTELRLVVGLHGPQDVPTLAYLMEALRWGGGGGELAVYAVDMVQLTDQTAAAIVKGGGFDGVTVVDEEVSEMRKLIGEALDVYQAEGGEGVKVRRLLALSSFPDMHSDICICAEDAMAALVLLPFHKAQRLDGSMDAGHFGFRLVNQKVLQLAPCSVGVVVDRGLGKHATREGQAAIRDGQGQAVVVVFIGGADDREALTLAALMSKHPGVRLTALRVVQNATAQARAKARTSLFETKAGAASAAASAAASSSVLGQEEAQMQVDDKFFAEFYRKHVAGSRQQQGGGGMGYLEKHVADGAELVAVLRGLQAEYRLFVVGRGRDRSSVLTEGLDEWAECLELGPVGDILASSDFSATASVLIVQQYDAKKHYKVIDEEFMPL
ncbi:Cation/H(+) antiporter 28 [Dichanthelium oligosanthes]|uniref:Cation/H(+) antiporter 28 n=1 Tax=Dichanthelium oligosanthes TaxID=888268 RepID=A0A1E5VKN3_9POAL|nr:Cation/H(+) antiporter 28 [Dichanthelium oligosanthes]